MAKKLFIIGNGFDIWSGLNSQFINFKHFYYNNQDIILKDLGLKSHGINNGHLKTDLEIVYGDPFNCFELTDSFWNQFENNLKKISYSQINQLFDYSTSGTINLALALVNSKKILDYAFEQWVKSLLIHDKNDSFRFDEDCIFINFNYTDTLTQLYGVNPNNVFHIHGSASSGDSIIYGHSMHAYHAPISLRENGNNRLFLVGEARYQFDKHALQNYLRLLCYLNLSGVNLKSISDVYVLGHSFNASDSFYFLLLSNAMLDKKHQTNRYDVDRSLAENYVQFLEEAEYIYDLAIAGVRQYSEIETRMINMAAFEEIGVFSDKDFASCSSAYVDEFKNKYIFKNEPCGDDGKRCYPKWHISYYQKQEKSQFEKALLDLGWGKQRLFLYDDIGKCLEEYKAG